MRIEEQDVLKKNLQSHSAGAEFKALRQEPGRGYSPSKFEDENATLNTVCLLQKLSDNINECLEKQAQVSFIVKEISDVLKR